MQLSTTTWQPVPRIIGGHATLSPPYIRAIIALNIKRRADRGRAQRRIRQIRLCYDKGDCFELSDLCAAFCAILIANASEAILAFSKHSLIALTDSLRS